MKQCIGYNPDGLKCRFGFDQSSICRGFLIGYQGNHDNPANIPQCCNVEACGKLYEKSGGRPKI